MRSGEIVGVICWFHSRSFCQKLIVLAKCRRKWTLIARNNREKQATDFVIKLWKYYCFEKCFSILLLLQDQICMIQTVYLTPSCKIFNTSYIFSMNSLFVDFLFTSLLCLFLNSLWLAGWVSHVEWLLLKQKFIALPSI